MVRMDIRLADDRSFHPTPPRSPNGRGLDVQPSSAVRPAGSEISPVPKLCGPRIAPGLPLSEVFAFPVVMLCQLYPPRSRLTRFPSVLGRLEQDLKDSFYRTAEKQALTALQPA